MPVSTSARAFASTPSSVTPQRYVHQLFQPIGGVRASGAACAGAATARARMRGASLFTHPKSRTSLDLRQDLRLLLLELLVGEEAGRAQLGELAQALACVWGRWGWRLCGCGGRGHRVADACEGLRCRAEHLPQRLPPLLVVDG